MAKTTNITEHFTLEEMTASAEAKKSGIKNVPTQKEKQNLKELCDFLELFRTHYGKAIRVTSGYRCQKLNTALGGSKTSSHVYGLAADLKPADGDMRDFQRKMVTFLKQTKGYDQVIFEKIDAQGIANWIHVGVRHGRTNSQRCQKLYTPDGKKYYAATANDRCMKV